MSRARATVVSSLVAALGLASVPAAAQETTSVGGGGLTGSAAVLGGWSRLVGEAAPDGGSVGGSARFMAEFGRFAAGLDGGYARFGETTVLRRAPCPDRSGLCTFIVQGSASSWRAAGLVRADFLDDDAAVRPHLTGGLGLYAISQFGSALHFLGYNLGAGASIGGAGGGLRYLIDVRWHDNLQILAADDRATAFLTVELGIGMGW